MTKVIRVKNTTFESLVNLGKWTDTMDDIICRLIYDKSDELDRKDSDVKMKERCVN